MKKIYYLISLFIFSLILPLTKTYAYTFEVSATSNSVTVGNSITLNIKVKDAAGKFTIASSNASVVSVSTSSLWIDNTTSSVTLKANSVGSSTISVLASDVTTYDGENVSITKPITITVNPKPTVSNNPSNNQGGTVVTPRAKSSNNFLSSLTIENYELDNKFDKETLEYTLTVPAETEKIKINAQLADSSSKVTGIGEVKLTTGINNLEIVVTAENGSKRTYKLKVTVKELTPLKVIIDKEEYTVIRKQADLPKISEYFTPKKVSIGTEEVDGYYNDTLDYTLVGLKNKTGNTNYYIYKNDKYTLYKEYTFNGTTVRLIDKELDKKYKSSKFNYDGDTINAYQEVKLDLLKNTYALNTNEVVGNQYYLFYAINVETGKEYLYQYDALEKTIQRYNTEVLDMYINNSNTYYTYLLGSILIIGLLVITISIILINNTKKNNRMYMYNKEKLNMKLEEEQSVEEAAIPVKKTKSKK